MQTGIQHDFLSANPHKYLSKYGKQIQLMYIACILNFFSYFPADTKMHPVLKNLGITDKVISFVVDSVNGNQVKKRRAQTLPAKRSNKAPFANVPSLTRALMWVHVLPVDVEESPARRAWWRDEMACVNSVRQALVSGDFCPPVTAVCWSFPGPESGAANRGNRPARLATQRRRSAAPENNSSRLTSVSEIGACRLCQSQACSASDLYSRS